MAPPDVFGDEGVDVEAVNAAAKDVVNGRERFLVRGLRETT
jgi:hypothetical protein